MKQKKRYLRELFRERGIFAERRLGQCFLVDGNLQELLIRTADIQKDDFVFEVGTGTGQLTELIAEKAKDVLSVEIDPALAELARGHLEPHANVDLRNVDVLAGKHHIHPDILTRLADGAEASGGYKLVANLPYYIALPLIQNLLESSVPWKSMVVTVQKEFAEKMTGAPRSAQYGAFSIMFQVWAKARVVRILPPGVFWPAPKIDSAVVLISPNPALPENLDYGLFRDTVRQAFSARRKMLSNSLKPLCERLGANLADLLKQAGISPDVRAETLTPNDFITIAQLLGR